MGIATVTAGRIRKGQINGQLGEDYLTEMEQFPHLGMVKTYNIDSQTSDSAAAATACLCGVKTQIGTIGVDGRAIRNDCPSSIGTNISSILDWAQTLGSSQPLLGLFEPDHMRYEFDRNQSNDDEPSFFLLIEGGRIDHAHHDTIPRIALDEFVEFDNAVGQAKRTLQANGALDDSLIIVTADHSHVFTIGSYTSRGSNILGFGPLEQPNLSDIDNAPVNIIAYGNGPNFNSSRNATYLYSLNVNSTDYRAPAAQPMSSETHAAEDVPVYAYGPWSHLFIGTLEQHTIAHKMAYAACWGIYNTREGCPKASASQCSISNLILVFLFLISLHNDLFLYDE
ncbi:unnamed protein product [Rotaria sordida]|uniref:alkaline phosphatase n=1 Tax=Rotaria sordida TaxID=392033 RepID=A0A819EYQ2_9BILA|nr:unnamed protein product [Rotaria sordida]